MYLPVLCRNIVRTMCTIQTKYNFVPIYKFPYIHIASMINRLKLYQTVATGVVVPCSITLSTFTDLLTTQDVLAISAIGFSGTLTFFLFGWFTNRLIGYVYVSDDNKVLKLAYADFWGRRKDVQLPAADITPFSDLPNLPLDSLYLPVQRFSTTKDKYKLHLRYGHILEPERFNSIFNNK